MVGGSGGRRLGVGLDGVIARRVPFVAALVILAFGVFFVRLFQLQVIEGDEMRLRSQRNSVRTVRLRAPRGDIVDRYGRTLASNRPAFGVGVIPSDLHRPELAFAALGMLLDGEPDELRERVGAPQGRARFQPVQLERDLSYDRLARVESHLYALPGVFTEVRPRRHYLHGELAAHVLGFIGEVRRDQLAKREFADYQPGEVVGQAGAEALLQPDLRGRAGGRNLVVDVAGRVVEVLDDVDPVPGGTVTLTLDLDLQRVAEEAFLPDVLGEPAKRGAAVVLDPRNGDILALVAKPSYDPNDFAGGIDIRRWQQLAGDERRPLQNRAISGQYPPGSTYKVFVAAGALEDGLVDPEERIFCPGSFRLGRRAYRCWKREGHGWVNLRDALVQSCDVYFYQLGLTIGIDRLAYFARGFNLGAPTGIRLAHEKGGLVPTSVWKEKRFKEPWLKGETVSASIGQGFDLVTPLQLATAYAAIANGGKLVRPRLVLRKEAQDGTIAPGPEPEVRGRVPVAAVHLAFLRDALEGVVQEPGGTGGRARVRGVRVAGKTGTSQVVALHRTEGLARDEVPLQHRDHAWFVGFAPVEAPEIVVAVLVEHGGHGGSAAAPITRRILARYFESRRAPGRAPAPVPTPTPAPQPLVAPGAVHARR